MAEWSNILLSRIVSVAILTQASMATGSNNDPAVLQSTPIPDSPSCRPLPETLPSNWRRAWSKTWQRVYYYNILDRAVQWEHPSGLRLLPTPAMSSGASEHTLNLPTAASTAGQHASGQASAGDTFPTATSSATEHASGVPARDELANTWRRRYSQKWKRDYFFRVSDKHVEWDLPSGALLEPEENATAPPLVKSVPLETTPGLAQSDAPPGPPPGRPKPGVQMPPPPPPRPGARRVLLDLAGAQAIRRSAPQGVQARIRSELNSISSRFGYTDGRPQRIDFDDAGSASEHPSSSWKAWIAQAANYEALIGDGVVDAWWQLRSHRDPNRPRFNGELHIGDEQRIDLLLEQEGGRIVVLHPGRKTNAKPLFYKPGQFEV